MKARCSGGNVQLTWSKTSYQGLRELDADEVLSKFVPTRRSQAFSFDSYIPDPGYSSQAAALEHMRAFAQAGRRVRAGLRLFKKELHTRKGRCIWTAATGVGKTHLRAATLHAVTGGRSDLSFAELTYTIVRLGMQLALDAFADARLLCIDEFELATWPRRAWPQCSCASLRATNGPRGHDLEYAALGPGPRTLRRRGVSARYRRDPPARSRW